MQFLWYPLKRTVCPSGNFTVHKSLHPPLSSRSSSSTPSPCFLEVFSIWCSVTCSPFPLLSWHFSCLQPISQGPLFHTLHGQALPSECHFFWPLFASIPFVWCCSLQDAFLQLSFNEAQTRFWPSSLGQELRNRPATYTSFLACSQPSFSEKTAFYFTFVLSHL